MYDVTPGKRKGGALNDYQELQKELKGEKKLLQLPAQQCWATRGRTVLSVVM
jgi:hypothetical protein